MRLPFAPPLTPMLSSAANALPGGDGWQFEPKWDGFRTLVFRDGAEVLLQSRDEKPMNRYFPELIAPLAAGLPERCVFDGEIVIVGADVRLRGCRVSLAQARARHDGRLAPSRPVRRRSCSAACRGHRGVHERRAQAARHRAGAASPKRARWTSLARLGRGTRGSQCAG